MPAILNCNSLEKWLTAQIKWDASEKKEERERESNRQYRNHKQNTKVLIDQNRLGTFSVENVPLDF